MVKNLVKVIISILLFGFVLFVLFVFIIDHYQSHSKVNAHSKDPQTACALGTISSFSDFLKHSTNAPSTSDPDEITLVSAYFDLGVFQKGLATHKYSPAQYKKWMRTFYYIKNPLIVFLEREHDIEAMTQLRRHLGRNRTKIIQISKSDLWTFRDLRGPISDIYTQKEYPKFYPSTVLPDYPCAMHAKYELMEASIRRNLFGATYFAWVDIGYFRQMKDSRHFRLVPPINFDPKRVAYTLIHPRDHSATTASIVGDAKVWVGGGFFLGAGPVLLRWVQVYFAEVREQIKAGWMNSDQQVIYSLRSHRQPNPDIQTYDGGGDWFYLGRHCKRV